MKKLFKAQGASSSNVRVRVYWGDILYDTVLCGPGEKITIGRKEGATFVMDLGRGATHAVLPLIDYASDGTAELRFDKTTEGHVRFDGKLVTLEAARKSKETQTDSEGFNKVVLGHRDKASVVIGYVSFDIDWIQGRESIARRIFSDKQNALAGAGMTMLAALLFLIISLTRQEKIDEPPPERIVEIIPPKELQRARAAMGQRKTEDGGAQKGDPGKVATTTPKETAPAPTAAETLRNANLGGLVSSLSSLSANTPAPTADARKTAAVAAAANQTGTGGFTTDGIAQGAGGKSVGIGRTVGAGEGGFEGTGKLGLSGNSSIEGGSGQGLVQQQKSSGGIDRNVIDQIVRRRQDRIRLCYERQLNFRPNLSGKITVQFVIGKEGEVVGTQFLEDTMKNDQVRDCISSEVKTWTFPKPNGGTLVKVDYPFVFASGGSSTVQ